MSDSITVKKGDYGYRLTFTFKDSDGNAYDLTGYTVKFKVWVAGVPGTLIVDGDCSITDAANGALYYEVQESDFDVDTEITYQYELEASQAGKVESSNTGSLTVVF